MPGTGIRLNSKAGHNPAFGGVLYKGRLGLAVYKRVSKDNYGKVCSVFLSGLQSFGQNDGLTI